MTKRHSRRTDEEWMELIQECRASGLTDKEWCREHQIHSSNFYYHIRRLREMACEIPESVSGNTRAGFQEVVPITFEEPFPNLPKSGIDMKSPGFDTAIRITVKGIQVEVSNHAAGETIATTLSVLQRLC